MINWDRREGGTGSKTKAELWKTRSTGVAQSSRETWYSYNLGSDQLSLWFHYSIHSENMENGRWRDFFKKQLNSRHLLSWKILLLKCLNCMTWTFVNNPLYNVLWADDISVVKLSWWPCVSNNFFLLVINAALCFLAMIIYFSTSHLREKGFISGWKSKNKFHQGKEVKTAGALKPLVISYPQSERQNRCKPLLS